MQRAVLMLLVVSLHLLAGTEGGRFRFRGRKVLDKAGKIVDGVKDAKDIVDDVKDALGNMKHEL